MLSVITAAKGRAEIFQKSVDALWTNAETDIEHLIAIDCKDKEMMSFVDSYQKKYSDKKITIYKVCFCKNGGYEKRRMGRDYWNYLTNNACGDIIFGMCNDTIILTKGFDRIIMDEVEKNKIKYKHSCFQILVDDDGDNDIQKRDTEFCSWIILTKPAADIIGGILPDEIISSGGDTYVYSIFEQTTIKSQIFLRDEIKTLHISHYNGSHKLDETTRTKPMHGDDKAGLSRKQYHLRMDREILKQYYENTNEKN